MSWDKNFRIRCDICGKYCTPADDETPFGCKNPEDPEPLDPDHFCIKCWPELKANWLKSFKDGSRYGYYQKSRAEMEAAEECGLVWVGDGLGTYGTDTHKFHQYITKEEYAQIKDLPRFVKKEEVREEIWL